jgi:hypothetical protein
MDMEVLYSSGEDYEERLRQAALARYIEQARRMQNRPPSMMERLLARAGRSLISWGLALQERTSAPCEHLTTPGQDAEAKLGAS